MSSVNCSVSRGPEKEWCVEETEGRMGVKLRKENMWKTGRGGMVGGNSDY